MNDVHYQFDRVQKAQEKWFDGRYDPRLEPARGVTIQIQGLLKQLTHLLHSYQQKVAAQSGQSYQPPVTQVTDLPGIYQDRPGIYQALYITRKHSYN